MDFFRKINISETEFKRNRALEDEEDLPKCSCYFGTDCFNKEYPKKQQHVRPLFFL